jgi:hypothetical protein
VRDEAAKRTAAEDELAAQRAELAKATADVRERLRAAQTKAAAKAVADVTAVLQQERTRRVEAEQQASEMRTQLRQLKRQLLAQQRKTGRLERAVASPPMASPSSPGGSRARKRSRADSPSVREAKSAWLPAPAAGEVGSREGCEAALADADGVISFDQYKDPGPSKRIGGFWYITRRGCQVRQAQGPVCKPPVMSREWVPHDQPPSKKRRKPMPCP